MNQANALRTGENTLYKLHIIPKYAQYLYCHWWWLA